MQTFSVQIEDNYMQQFMNFVNKSHSNIIITKDKNLELDPYFYERQKIRTINYADQKDKRVSI